MVETLRPIYQAEEAARLAHGTAATKEADDRHDEAEDEQQDHGRDIVLAHLGDVAIVLRVPPKVARQAEDAHADQL